MTGMTVRGLTVPAGVAPAALKELRSRQTAKTLVAYARDRGWSFERTATDFVERCGFVPAPSVLVTLVMLAMSDSVGRD